MVIIHHQRASKTTIIYNILDNSLNQNTSEVSKMKKFRKHRRTGSHAILKIASIVTWVMADELKENCLDSTLKPLLYTQKIILIGGIFSCNLHLCKPGREVLQSLFHPFMPATLNCFRHGQPTSCSCAPLWP